ncbi:MAG TPA: PAS domain S-box protein [Acidobacteriota bacterium]|nr:PAS domain S-box protein [Acidobacteriota bacterium]
MKGPQNAKSKQTKSKVIPSGSTKLLSTSSGRDESATHPPEDTVYRQALSQIVQSSQEAILSKDLGGIILTWNKGAQEMYGYTPEEIIGKPVSALAPEGTANEIPEIMRKIRQGEVIDRYETIRRKKDGTLINVSLSISPVRNKRGKIIGASAVAHNITEEKRLRDLRNFLASIVDTSDDAIISKDLNGYILSWNKGAEKLYGYTSEEAIGKHASITTLRERQDEVDQILQRLKNGERVEHYETMRVTKYGNLLDVSLSVSPVLNSKGELIAASVIARDITARKKAEEERSRLLAELARSLQEKNVLLQEVYHRVKNNLQVVGSLLELRSRTLGQDPQKANEAFLDSVNRIRAMALIHESLYKLQSLDKVDFLSYLRTLSNQLVNSYAPYKKVEININGNSQLFGLDMAVPLGLIFNELITNTLKYAYPESDNGVMEIHFHKNKEMTFIRISDNGIGLPQDLNFVDSNSFGFRIVKLLAKQLNGSIHHVPNQPGTVFELKILEPAAMEKANAL